MTEEQVRRLIHRVQVKEILRRQATIKPGDTMFDGVCPIEYGTWHGGHWAGIMSLDTIIRRVVVLENWIDSKLDAGETL